MTDWRLIANSLAAALRNMPCRCIEIGSWPLFKAEAAGTPERPGKHIPKKCARCVALGKHDLAVADEQIVQHTPTDAEHVTNIQLSALIYRIEHDGWARLDIEDIDWLKAAMAPPAIASTKGRA